MTAPSLTFNLLKFEMLAKTLGLFEEQLLCKYIHNSNDRSQVRKLRTRAKVFTFLRQLFFLLLVDKNL